MDQELEAVLGVVIAALGGLAIGLERQRGGHASGPNARFAGIRTFTLLGILAGLSGWMWSHDWRAPAALILFGAVGLIVAAYAASAPKNIDATTEVAALVVLAAGVLAATSHWALAGGTIAVTALLLVEKSRIHQLVARLDDYGVRAGVRFAVMAVVILPLLPAGPYGPWGGIRPRSLWVFVLLFSGISFAGYIARRALGSLGYAVTGLLGGLVSSTNVMLVFSRLSRREKSFGVAMAAGTVAASTILFLRVLAATAALNLPLARAALPYFVAPFLVGAAFSAMGFRGRQDAASESQEPRNPLQFWTSLQMAVLFQIVFYAVYWLQRLWGNSGILALATLLGLFDMDALTVSMARGGDGLEVAAGAQALAVGVLSNTGVKATIAIVLGAGRFRWLAASGMVLIAMGLVASIFVLR
jgi:uncharacterized membrane protein (DUF4010 family)